uniref:Uncharacterized protein n=1 Tax=Oryctolagus cuniculus TaxID=9986 RepID=A0A5F9CX09_RABIT
MQNVGGGTRELLMRSLNGGGPAGPCSSGPSAPTPTPILAAPLGRHSTESERDPIPGCLPAAGPGFTRAKAGSRIPRRPRPLPRPRRALAGSALSPWPAHVWGGGGGPACTDMSLLHFLGFLEDVALFPVGPATALVDAGDTFIVPHLLHLLHGIDGLHVVANEPQPRGVQLLLVASPGVVVLQPEVLGGEEFGEEPHEEAGGEVADRQALLHDLAHLLVRQQVGRRHGEVGGGHHQLVQGDLAEVLAAPLGGQRGPLELLAEPLGIDRVARQVPALGARHVHLALLLVGAPLLCVPAPAALVQFAHELQGPDAVVFGPGVQQLHVVADQLDAGRVQLLLAQGAAAVVLLAQVLVGEELGEQVHQQAGGEVADGQAALVDAAQLLLAQQAVGARQLEVGLRDLQLVEVDGHQPDLLGAPPGPLALEAVLHLDHGDVVGQAGGVVAVVPRGVAVAAPVQPQALELVVEALGALLQPGLLLLHVREVDLRVVADDLQPLRVQLLLAAVAVAAVLLPQLAVVKELREEPVQQEDGELAGRRGFVQELGEVLRVHHVVRGNGAAPVQRQRLLLVFAVQEVAARLAVLHLPLSPEAAEEVVELRQALGLPHGRVLHRGVVDLHVVADELQVQRLQLALGGKAAGAAAAGEVHVAEEFREELHQQAAGQVAAGQALVHDLLELGGRELVLGGRLELGHELRGAHLLLDAAHLQREQVHLAVQLGHVGGERVEHVEHLLDEEVDVGVAVAGRPGAAAVPLLGLAEEPQRGGAAAGVCLLQELVGAEQVPGRGVLLLHDLVRDAVQRLLVGRGGHVAAGLLLTWPR